MRIETREDCTALMFICTTGLVEEFRDLYGDQLDCEGKRAILLSDDTPIEPLRHCIAIALTHKLRKRA